MRSLFRTVCLVRNGFDAWCAACGRIWNALMSIAIYIPQLWIGWIWCVTLIHRVNIHSWLHVWWMQTYVVSLWGNTSIKIVLLMQSIRFVCKFNMRGDFYPHPGVRIPPAWTNSFYVFTCHWWSCVLYISVTDGVCTGKCFLTEIYSDTQLMQKYRDISLKGGLLTPCYPNYTGLVDEIGIPKRKLFA